MCWDNKTPLSRQRRRGGSGHSPPLTSLPEYASQNRQKRIRPLAPHILSRRMKHCYALAAPSGLPESEYGFIGLSVESPSGYLMKARTSRSTNQGEQK